MDGSILVTGGDDANKVSIYNTTTEKWSNTANMNIGRGYQASSWSIARPPRAMRRLG